MCHKGSGLLHIPEGKFQHHLWRFITINFQNDTHFLRVLVNGLELLLDENQLLRQCHLFPVQLEELNELYNFIGLRQFLRIL